MAINRSQIRDLLLPGLQDITGKYPQIPQQWSQVFSTATSKMALERSVEARYTGLAQLKAEGGATTFDNSAGERFIYNANMISIGLGFAITREALDDNLYKEQFNPQSLGLVESFAQTKEILCANILNTITTYDASVGGDGKALAATDHPIDGGTYQNTPTVQLSLNESALETGLNQIRVFPDQAGLKTFARGKKLVVPINLQWTAERLTKTELRPGTGNNDVNAVFTTRGLPDGYVVMDFLTSNFAWGIITNVNKLIFYERTPFEMDLQVDPTTGNLLVIGYERYQPSYTDPRSIWWTTPSA